MNLLVTQIKNAALNLGYEKCGIIKIADMSGYEKKLDERIDIFPEVKKHYEKFYNFANLQAIYPWARSIIVCARQYGKYAIPEHLKGLIAKYYLVDSRTDANSDSFQDSLKFEEYLYGLGIKTATERRFGITALRWAAQKAGIGLVRKNNFFYTESGSWVYLEAWLIDKELESIEIPALQACPKNCKRCVNACPTSSLAKPYIMNRSSCISCLTTWEGWDLPNEKFNKQMGSWIFGCDVCQDICPMNKTAWNVTEEFPGLSKLSHHISLEKIIKMDYTFLEKVMQPKFWYIDKKDVWRWKTNAINSMVNNYKQQYREYILYASNDSNAKVREMAKWAMHKLNLK